MITKIDKDTYEIKTETVETVSLSQLEAELEFIETYNRNIEELTEVYETLPENIKQYVQIPTPIMRDFKKEELVKTLKEKNG